MRCSQRCSTFKDWRSEQTGYPNEMSEMALAHKVSDNGRCRLIVPTDQHGFCRCRSSLMR
jgi:hypothetical protein